MTDPACRRRFLRQGARLLAAGAVGTVLSAPARAAMAGERQLALHHTHTQERIELVYAVDDRYLPAALGRLDTFLRDHYSGEVGHIDPLLYDQLHQLQRQLVRAARSRSSPATAARAPTRSCARRAAAASRRTACTCRAARSTCGCPGCRWPSCARRRSRCARAASATTRRAASCMSTPGACAAGDATPRVADTVVDRRAGAPQRATAARRRLDQNRSGSRSPRAVEAACT